MTTIRTTNDIHDEFDRFHHGKQNKLPTVSVYIPSVHIKYDNAAIWNVFNYAFGIVNRIDVVSIKSKDGNPTNFRSVFVHYVPLGRNDLIGDIARNGQMRINPNVNTMYMNKYHWQPNAKIRASEYWLLLPNNSSVPYTKLSLDQIEAKMNDLVPKIVDNEEERESLAANREFLVELRAKQNREMAHYIDNSINIHQLAHNIELMEARMAAIELIIPPEIVALNECQRDYVNKNAMLLVTDIPELSFEPEIWDYFIKYGYLLSVKVCRHPETKKSLCYGYVCFKDTETAEHVVEEEHEQFSVVLAKVE
jgi:hypothetical protein